MGSFRNTKWDPILLITQIVAMQSLLYASLGALMWFMDLLAGANHTLDHLFQYHVRTLGYHGRPSRRLPTNLG